jgi:presenilin-like A22 family membrane protease
VIAIFVNHYRMADVAIIHGLFVLLTGLMLLSLKLRNRWILRIVHAVLGVMTSFYALLTYLITP